jgi:hypothetical protein
MLNDDARPMTDFSAATQRLRCLNAQRLIKVAIKRRATTTSATSLLLRGVKTIVYTTAPVAIKQGRFLFAFKLLGRAAALVLQ